MALFGGTKSRTSTPGVRPYFPTPEEQASALPGLGQVLLNATAGGGVLGGGSTYQTPGYSDGVPGQAMGQRGGLLSSAITSALGQQPGAGTLVPGADLPGMQPSSTGSHGQILRGMLEQQLPPQAPVATSMPSEPTSKPKHPGFFKHGGLGEKILHGVGEFALRYSAGQGDPYATMVLRNRFEQHQQQLRLIEQVKQRQAEREEWTWRENYKRAHPDDQFTQYMQAAGIDPASPQGQALYRQRAESMAAPPLMAVDGYDAQGNQTKTFYPRTAFGGGMGGQSGPAGLAPGTVRNGYRFNGGNPNDRNSWVPVGGASPGGGATFR